MSSDRKMVIKARDFGTGTVFSFSTLYRFGVNPKHMFSEPNFTDETAFVEFDYLKNAPVGEIVFIEWSQDRFYALDTNSNEYIPGPTVWRKSEILERLDVPV